MTRETKKFDEGEKKEAVTSRPLGRRRVYPEREESIGEFSDQKERRD